MKFTAHFSDIAPFVHQVMESLHHLTSGPVWFKQSDIGKIFLCVSSTEGKAFLSDTKKSYKKPLEYLLPDENAILNIGETYHCKGTLPNVNLVKIETI